MLFTGHSFRCDYKGCNHGAIGQLMLALSLINDTLDKVITVFKTSRWNINPL